jgi:hypothetical protein
MPTLQRALQRGDHTFHTTAAAAIHTIVVDKLVDTTRLIDSLFSSVSLFF